MLISLCPFPLVLGSAQAAPLLSSGVAKAIPGQQTSTGAVGGVPVVRDGGFASVSGVPTEAGAYIVPAIVVGAMKELGVHPNAGVRLFTPAPLKEEGGVKYAPFLIEHFAGE